MIKTSMGLSRYSSAIFSNLRQFSKYVRQRPYDFLTMQVSENFQKSSESGRKSWELKSSNTPSSLCIYNTNNITRELQDMTFMSLWQEQYLTCLLRSPLRFFLAT